MVLCIVSDREPVIADTDAVSPVYDELDLCNPTATVEYINRIRNRLNEDENARNEREKRRRKVLFEQLKAHEAQEVMQY